MTRIATRRATRIVVCVAVISILTAADQAPHAPTSATDLRRSAATIACDTTTPFALDTRDRVVDTDTSSDSDAVVLRQAWSLPSVSVGDISFVTDSTTCARAAVARAIQTQRDTLNPAPVWVLRVGPTTYVAFHGDTLGEFMIGFVFDTSFTFLTTM